MSRAGVIATITSILKSSRTPPQENLSPSTSDDYDEEAGLVANNPSSSSPQNTAYGTVPLYTHGQLHPGRVDGTSTAGQRQLPGHEDHDDALDGNDAAVWKDVQTQGLDGRGSIADTEESNEFRELLDGYEANQAMLKDVTYGRLLAKYATVPVVILLVFASLFALVRYAWPPTIAQRQAGSPYPHPFLTRSFLIGVFTSISVQAVRVPLYDVLDSFALTVSGGVVLGRRTGLAVLIISVVLHTTVHELIRLLSITLLVIPPTAASLSAVPSANDLFQHVYYLALGWGMAEASWGIAAGWGEGIRLYWDVMRQPTPKVVVDNMPQPSSSAGSSGWWSSVTTRFGRSHKRKDEESHYTPPRQVDTDGQHVVIAEDFGEEGADEASEDGSATSEEEKEEQEDLERKIGILERMKGRRDLEEVLGLPFPNIPLVLHYLWRIDTLLLNLGLTLFVSAYYYDAEPIYPIEHERSSTPGVSAETSHPHRLLPLVMAAAIALHALITLLWNLSVRSLGVGAISWGSLMVSLGSLFAGIGAWGGLV